MKPEELNFLFSVCESQDWLPWRDRPCPASVREVIAASQINHKRCWRWLEKWSAKGWYDYGTSIDCGWMTPEGIEAASKLRKERA